MGIEKTCGDTGGKSAGTEREGSMVCGDWVEMGALLWGWRPTVAPMQFSNLDTKHLKIFIKVCLSKSVFFYLFV